MGLFHCSVSRVFCLRYGASIAKTHVGFSPPWTLEPRLRGLKEGEDTGITPDVSPVYLISPRLCCYSGHWGATVWHSATPIGGWGKADTNYSSLCLPVCPQCHSPCSRTIITFIISSIVSYSIERTGHSSPQNCVIFEVQCSRSSMQILGKFFPQGDLFYFVLVAFVITDFSPFFLSFLSFFFLVWRVLLYSLDWPQTRGNSPASSSWEWRRQTYSSLSSSCWLIETTISNFCSRLSSHTATIYLIPVIWALKGLRALKGLPWIVASVLTFVESEFQW